jgi:hypothetical protein
MATQKQIEANRRNAKKSTGPKTEAGKAKAKFNAVKHGMTAEVAVLPHEDKHSYEELRRSTIESYQPANGTEYMLAELVAINYWRLLRAMRVETTSFELHIKAYKKRHGVSLAPSLDDDCGVATALADPHATLNPIQRYQMAIERAYLRAVETLRKVQNDRLRQERQSGFVPQAPQARFPGTGISQKRNPEVSRDARSRPAVPPLLWAPAPQDFRHVPE